MYGITGGGRHLGWSLTLLYGKSGTELQNITNLSFPLLIFLYLVAFKYEIYHILLTNLTYISLVIEMERKKPLFIENRELNNAFFIL